MVNKLHSIVASTTAAEALERLFLVAGALGDRMAAGLAERGLTRARAAVIWLVHREGPVTQRRLAGLLDVTPRNVTGLVDALERDGFVVRNPHPTDRRATLVGLSQLGRTTATRLAAENHAGATRLFAGVDAADLHRFVSILDHVLTRLTPPSAPDEQALR